MEEHEEVSDMLTMLMMAISDSSDAMAEAMHDQFEAYKEAGFSEERAFELVKSNPIDADFTR